MVCSLIFTLGLWLNPCHVTHFSPTNWSKDMQCQIFFTSGRSEVIVSEDCDAAAIEFLDDWDNASATSTKEQSDG